jgi:hypothetical protein
MLTVAEQIYGLSQIWCEAKYNFAFWNIRSNLDWDKEYQEAVGRVMRPMELIDYYLELMKFISLLNDGHSFVNFPVDISNCLLTLPIKIKWLNQKHIITNVAEGYDIPLFSEILEINGMCFDQYMKEKVLPYCWNAKPSSSYEMLYTFSVLSDDADKNAYTLIPVLERNSEINLLTSNGSFRIKPVPRRVNWSLPVRLKCSEELTEIFSSEGLIIQLTKDNIAVITMPTFMDDHMPENFYRLLNQIKNCKGFIIDVRSNGGGHSHNADAFSQAFIKGKFQSGKVKHAIHIGAYKAWGAGSDFSDWDLTDPLSKAIYDVCHNNLFEEEITTAHYPNCPVYLDQPVVILENAATGSSSENLLINFDSINRATILGVPSYGSTGNPYIFKLPGGGLARVCTRRYTYPNDKEFINIGIQPHIYADLSQEDLIMGRDSVLDKGLEVIRL